MLRPPSVPVKIANLAQIYKDRGFMTEKGEPTKLWFETTGEQHAKNVYMRLDGTIAPLPFRSPKPGMWRFDGCVFYLPKGSNDV